jgi:hypothetical protein
LSSFASGGWYVDTAGCILQGDVRTKVKTPDTGEIMVEEAVQTSTWRAVQTPLFPVQGHAWSPTFLEDVNNKMHRKSKTNSPKVLG